MSTSSGGHGAGAGGGAPMPDAGTTTGASVGGGADAGPAEVVCFFADSNYMGNSFCVGPGAQGDTTPEWNDVVSSVKVTPGYKVELFADAGFQGRDLTLIADEPHVSGCFMNDLMSSFRVSVDTPSPLQSVNFLRKISGCKIASGQHNDEKQTPYDSYTSYVTSTTGKTPALWSGDFGFALTDSDRWAVTTVAEAQWEAGALINMMFHACPPTVPGPTCGWNDVNSDSYENGDFLGNFPDLVQDGGVLNAKWKARLDELVPYFEHMKSKGVEVLFRPFHEMNQKRFWWSKPGPDGTAKLFELTRDYLIKTKGLTNVGFVWDVQDIYAGGTGGADFADYNPGEGNFDVAALDVYGDGYSNTEYYDALVAQSFGRPVVIGETFQGPSPAVQMALPQMAYFMIWAYGVYPPGTHPPAPGISVGDLQSLYDDPRVVTLADMPLWK